MITEDYCSFEVSKLLKEKGFNEQCRAAYTNYGQLFTTQIQQYVTNVLCSKGTLWNCTAPTHQMATKWLREKHDLHIIAYPFKSGNDTVPKHWGCCVYKTFYLLGYDRYTNETLNSYEQAVEAALKYSLENLIKENNPYEKE